MRFPRFRKPAGTKEPAVGIDDPRLEGWETVSTFEERRTAVAAEYGIEILGPPGIPA